MTPSRNRDEAISVKLFRGWAREIGERYRLHVYLTADTFHARAPDVDRDTRYARYSVKGH